MSEAQTRTSQTLSPGSSPYSGVFTRGSRSIANRGRAEGCTHRLLISERLLQYESPDSDGCYAAEPAGVAEFLRESKCS